MVRQALLEYQLNGTFAGLSVFNFDDAATNANMTTGMTALFDYVVTLLPLRASASWDGVVDDLNTGTGQLEARVTLASLTGSGSAAVDSCIPQNASLLLNWTTAGVVNGRFVKGRTFVPLISRSFAAADGDPNPVIATPPNPAGLVVWSRPLKEGDPPVITRMGTAHAVTLAGRDADEWATQGSRRRA